MFSAGVLRVRRTLAVFESARQRTLHLITAISAVKLLLLAVLGPVFIVGQGWLIVGPVLHGSLTSRRSGTSFSEEIPLLLTVGLIVNYGILLDLQFLSLSLICGLLAGGIGLACLSVSLFRNPVVLNSNASQISRAVGAAGYCLLFVPRIIAEPLLAWDARSIWFFHAKMIYSAGALSRSTGLQHASAAFSFSYYPSLVPALAGQVAYLLGFWNEYVPKLSLLFLLLAPMAWLFSFARRSLTSLFLFLTVPFLFSTQMWNGYMDGYLALYFLVGALLLGRYIQERHFLDLISSLCCLLLLLYFKNEGVIAVLAGLCLAILAGLARRKLRFSFPRFSLIWRYIVLCLVLLVPFLTWERYKRLWGLRNPYGFAANEPLQHIYARLGDGSLRHILANMWGQTAIPLAILGLLLVTALAWKVPAFTKESLAVLLITGFYCLGLIGIYLLTPYDLPLQLQYSIARTMLVVSAGIFVASYFTLNRIEKSGNLDQ
jgi:hypothetical protein